ncbi:MAG: hypothetical protein J0M35_17375, partial [Candidatus Obscuribacter phosphatis]|nr:hypothetical protein [Candidatus Obscuribacter phosphatis]
MISWFDYSAALPALLAVPSILAILLLALRYGQHFGLSLSGESSRKVWWVRQRVDRSFLCIGLRSCLDKVSKLVSEV